MIFSLDKQTLGSCLESEVSGKTFTWHCSHLTEDIRASAEGTSRTCLISRERWTSRICKIFPEILETEIAQQQKEVGDAYIPRKTYFCFWRLKLELVCLITTLSSPVSRGATCKTSYWKQVCIQFWPHVALWRCKRTIQDAKIKPQGSKTTV